ncbi:MAG: RNA polymerase sigma factor [Planctomycetota bacterium]
MLIRPYYGTEIWGFRLDEFSDDILVAASQRGDKAAYGILVKRHYRHVFALSLGVLGNVDDAEDIAQDAMLKGFVKIRQLRDEEQFGRWILRIAQHLCIDLLRRNRYARAFTAKQTAERQREGNENHELVKAISRLPREIRVPLVMYYFDNRSAKAIAEKLKISHSGVCQRIRAARKQLHRLLTEGVQNEE